MQKLIDGITRLLIWVQWMPFGSITYGEFSEAWCFQE